ncbi:MAG: hypothetical protein J6C41_01170 [Oscillospiraceae bacterium]|nr:hypothetical protein [Oscillospiraceae bacterium]
MKLRQSKKFLMLWIVALLVLCMAACRDQSPKATEGLGDPIPVEENTGDDLNIRDENDAEKDGNIIDIGGEGTESDDAFGDFF